MENLIDKLPEIIREAAQSNLGILALLLIVLSALAYLFFIRSSEKIKVGIFVLLFFGACGFVFTIFRAVLTSEEPRTGTPSVNPQNKPNHRLIPSEVSGEFAPYWNSGSPTWDMLKSKAGDSESARIIPWTEGCFYCEAQRDTSTRCWPSMSVAIQYAWHRGFIGYSPEQEAWCNPPSWATRIEPNSLRFWLD